MPFSGRAAAVLWTAAVALLPASAACAAALPRYDVHVKVLPDALAVDAEIALPAAAEERKSLRFELLPGMGTPEVRLVAPAGSLSLRKVKDEGDALKPRTTWEIVPAVPFAAGRPVVLHMSHSGGGGGALVHYVGPEVIIASGIVQPWFAQFSQAKILGTLSLDMPAGFLAMASGTRVSERVVGGRRSVAFRMTTPMQINFVAAPYKVHKVFRKEGEIPVSLYLLKDRDFAGDLVDIVHRSLATLEKEFGPPPYKEFAVVEFPTDPGLKASFGGASQDGYMLMRTDDLDRKRADPTFFGHEIGHQWWGVSVSYAGGDGGDFMLDEALAEYGAIRVIEAVKGSDAAKAFRDDQRDKVIKRIGAGYDGPLMDMPETPPSGAAFFYQDLARAKGALIYDVIDRSIGADRMRPFFRAITSEYANSSNIAWHDFVARLRQAAGAQNRWLIDQWLDRKGLPVLDVKWSARNGEVALEIGQPQEPLYQLALPVRLDYADGSAETRQIEVAAQPKTGIVLPVARSVSRVALDPDRTMPWVGPQEFADAVAVRNFTLAWSIWDEGRNDDAEKILKTALEARAAPDATEGEFLERYNYGWLLELDHKDLAGALDQYMRALALPVRAQGRDEDHLIQLYVNLARVASAMGDKARARWAAQAAIALIDAGEEDGYRKRTRPEARKYLQ